MMTPQELASRWTSRRPELASRIARALPLIEGVTLLTAGFWTVNNGGDVSLVWTDPTSKESSCECKDSQSGHPCKHRLAVALVHASQNLRCMRRKVWENSVEEPSPRAS